VNNQEVESKIINSMKKQDDGVLATFDPHGTGYDDKTANELIEMWPLEIEAPDRDGEWDGEEIGTDESIQAWIWHKDEKEWVIHGPTLDPRPYELIIDGEKVEGRRWLKGMAKGTSAGHPSYDSMIKGMEEEERLGSKVIFYEPHQRYYSVPRNQSDEHK
tara:strand:- start:3667 stop:4146 length:480 start_codon:yes stop_codon:yes gene_type:complete